MGCSNTKDYDSKIESRAIADETNEGADMIFVKAFTLLLLLKQIFQNLIKQIFQNLIKQIFQN